MGELKFLLCLLPHRTGREQEAGDLHHDGIASYWHGCGLVVQEEEWTAATMAGRVGWLGEGAHVTLLSWRSKEGDYKDGDQWMGC